LNNIEKIPRVLYVQDIYEGCLSLNEHSLDLINKRVKEFVRKKEKLIIDFNKVQMFNCRFLYRFYMNILDNISMSDFANFIEVVNVDFKFYLKAKFEAMKFFTIREKFLESIKDLDDDAKYSIKSEFYRKHKIDLSVDEEEIPTVLSF
jgi:hypothetical protein